MAWYEITGTVADWVMAGSAVYAAANAKEWFAQRQHSKGIDEAEEVLSSIDVQFNEVQACKRTIDGIVQYWEDITNYSATPDESKMREYTNLIELYNNQESKVLDVMNKLSRIERWSIEVVDYEIIDSVLTKAQEVYKDAQSISRTAYACVYNLTNMSISEFKESYDMFSEQHKELNNRILSFYMAYNSLHSENFNNLFKIKKPR